MKKKIFVVNEIKAWFPANEENACKIFCENYGYSYRVEYVNI